MDVWPIKNEKQYEAALLEIERLMPSTPDTPDGDRLDVIATLVEAYERETYPLALPDAVAAIEYAMERIGLPTRTTREGL